MDGNDIIKRLGLPVEVIGRKQRMRSLAWACSECREKVTSAVPITVPAPCTRCGGIVFETVRSERQ